jgi:phosphatidylglycerophosphate synthase
VSPPAASRHARTPRRRPGLRLADALGILRLVAAVALPRALAGALAGRRWWLPVALFAVGAASDFLDGVVARRGRGPTRHGAVLDNVADIAFVLAGTGAGAALGLVPAAVPAAIAVAFAAYVLASVDRSARAGSWAVARSHVGHAAGVLNYALTGLIVGAAALPCRLWGPALRLGSAVVLVVNLGAVLERAVPWAARPARGPRGAGRGAR